MAGISAKSNETLNRIIKSVNSTHSYFEDNYRRFREYRNMVFKTSINENQKTILNQINNPVIEFNFLEAYISRLLGEFAKHEPGIEVTPSEGVPVDQKTLDVVEGYLRHMFHKADKDNFSYDIYKDMLSGGFSVAKIWTDYAGPFSFEQQIYVQHVFDPTLCGFDPMARTTHKGDGSFSFEVYPMLEDDFEKEFPGIDLGNLSYQHDIEGFHWTFKNNDNRRIVLVCDYYEKKKKRERIVKLANGRTMTKKAYEKLELYWQKEQFIEQIPVIVNTRMTDIEVIVHYVFIESQILKYEETDYSYLPHVFFDGNSIMLTEGNSNNVYQMTRPYIYHARGIQDMANFAGQTICNAMENLVQSKFIVMKEAIPQEKDYLEALTDHQRANTIVVNAYSENNPDKPIPQPIREIQNLPLPPEVVQAFQLTGPMSQTILGSFTANLGKVSNDLSGKAIIEAASLDNAASMPYIVSYLTSLGQIANIAVDLMPKYLVGKRTVPVVQKNGEKSYQDINAPGNPMIVYDEKSIKVNIDAGVNFQVQKSQAMQEITGLMSVSQEFNSFMNSPDGLKVLVKNLTCYGSDELQEAIPKWIELQQQQAQAAQQNNPQMQLMQMQMQVEQQKAQSEQTKNQLKEMELQLKAQKDEMENQLEIARIAIENKLADAKVIEAESKVSQAQIDSAVRLEESQTSLEVHALESATKLADIQSRHHERALKTHAAHLDERRLEHEIEKSARETGRNEE